MINNEIGHAWIYNKDPNGFGKNSNGSYYFEGGTIYSYGSHFPIAKKYRDNIILITSKTRSSTTSRHISLVWSTIDCIRFNVFEVPDVVIDIDDKEQHKANLKYLINVIDETYLKLKRARKHILSRWVGLENVQNTLKDYVRIFDLNVGWYQEDYDRVTGYKLSDEERHAIEEKQCLLIEETNKRYLKKLKENIAKWRDGKIDYISGSKYTYLKVKGKKIYTSKGISITLDKAEVICKCIFGGLYSYGKLVMGKYPYYGIKEDGISIGCHLIPIEEVCNIMKELGWDYGQEVYLK